MILGANVLWKLSVTSETYRATDGTHRRIDGTTTMGWLTAIVQVLAPLDGQLENRSVILKCSKYTDGVGPII